MRKFLRPAAVGLTAVAAIVATVLRIVITPYMQDGETGDFHVSYYVIGFLLFTMAALAILVFAGEGRIRHPISMVRHDCMPMGLSSAALGFVLIISSLFDGWSWLAFNRTPPPNETIINNLDSTTLTFTLIFGVLAGMFLMWLGAKLIAGSLKPGTGVSMGALTPVIWIWVRVVRMKCHMQAPSRLSKASMIL